MVKIKRVLGSHPGPSEILAEKLVTSHEQEPSVSYLRCLFPSERGYDILHQSKITDHGLYTDFRGFVIGFKRMAIYPDYQPVKSMTYAWTPTLFEEAEYKGRLGHWRRGEHATGELSLFYADCDNNNEAEPCITLDQIETAMKEIGCAYLLYTSFSHTEAKHKVRIVAPISRNVSYRECFRLHLFFNELMHRQLDASIYDPADYLYGPGPSAEIRINTNGLALDVDRILAVPLPDSTRAALDSYEAKAAAPTRALSPEESRTLLVALKATAPTVSTSLGEISIRNPRLFNPAWINDLHACANGGSHRQTLYQVLTKTFLKSQYALSAFDLSMLQNDMDSEMGFYCKRKYGANALASDVKSVLRFRGTNPSYKSEDDFGTERTRARMLTKYRR
ncbi:hypothetical protein SAMN02799631_05185 [Methylobacterium sp. 174MFSha1.1]|uniref:hypothetical protein n=1 Tax=Methylobacterium sp. 174MFSha1.1 TaxID=1502749 RepID=UPI0008F39E7B|nr:hypothetical protein [Methylobacterium sp. 174MFSha1.1]SFV11013.1 hypothetical protein SAMN02799631_05185 [Methylobacterium sp. 174MFSha1.1]